MDNLVLFGVCLFIVALFYVKIKAWIWFVKYEPVIADWIYRKLMRGIEWLITPRNK